MDDIAEPSWAIDPETRSRLRLDIIHRAMENEDFVTAIVELEELLHESPEQLEALELLADCTLELGDAMGAVPIYEHRLRAGDANVDLLCGLAVARFEACEIVGAVEAARDAIRQDPSAAEAHYTLGLALELLPGKSNDASQAFVAARQLDSESYPFPLTHSADDWKALLETALLTVPHPIAEFWQGVPFHLLDRPDLDELRDSDPPIAPSVLGLFLGEPPEGEAPDEFRPEAMRLYLCNLARLGDDEHILDEIGALLEAEAEAWLGYMHE